jgi:hypothetical protein
MPAGFHPKPIHWQYLDAVLEALATSGNVSDRAIAEKIDRRNEAISRWRRTNPAFDAWVQETIRTRARGKGALLLDRCANLGIRGSAKHAELYFRVTGEIQSETGGGAAAVNVTIVGIPAASSDLAAWPGGVLEAPKPVTGAVL